LELLPSSFYPARKKIIFSTGFFGVDFTKTSEYRESEIIHLHWINGGFVDIKILKKINKPIVWTIRDMWPMTGGCHVALECQKFKTGCGRCDQLNSKANYDLSQFILNRKNKYFPKNMKIVAISNWLKDQAKASQLLKDFDIRMISNNINTDEFFPVDKSLAKKILGIKTEKKIILVGAADLSDPWKGFGNFLEAAVLLDNSKYFLCTFGRVDNSVIKSLGFEYKNFGFLNDNISLRLLYSSANVFVAPSIADSFGKTLAESMACKTPVVCFDAQGPKDIVIHKIDGYRAEKFNINDLKVGIEWVLENADYDILCKKGLEKVLKEFDSAVVAAKYIDLYKEMLNNLAIKNLD
jgi:glycosyltransferase involved in cell wall biosynthesis